MLRHPGRFTASMVAGLALLLGGCGGGSTESTGELASADPAPPPAAPADLAPPPPGNTEQAAPEAPGSGEAAVAEAPAAPAEAAPAPSTLAAAPEEAPAAAPVAAEPSSRRVENAAATDDLLQLAQAAIASPVTAPAASSGSSSGMPGDSSSATANGYGAPTFGPGYGPPSESGSRSEAALRQGSSSAAPGAMPGDAMAAGPAGSSGSDSGYPGAEASGIAGAHEADYSDAIKGAQSFLAAVQSKDVERIADAVALRSVSTEEGSVKYKKTFQAILDRSVDPQVMDDIYETFKDMKVVGTNTVKSSGSRGVIVGHQNDKHEFITRTLTMRREKAGWKVLDISGYRVQRMTNYNRNNNNRRN